MMLKGKMGKLKLDMVSVLMQHFLERAPHVVCFLQLLFFLQCSALYMIFYHLLDTSFDYVKYRNVEKLQK